MTILPPISDEAEIEAATWFSKSRSDEMSVTDQLAMQDWLNADERNRQAYDSYATLWSALGGVENEPAVLALRDRVRRRAKHRWWTLGALATAASIALAIGMPEALRQAPSITARASSIASLGRSAATPIDVAPTAFSTGIGQVSHLTLPDGSKVILDADSTLSVRFDQAKRLLSLQRGRALFEVAHELRPFIVAGGRFTVRATGTKFVVEHDAKGQSVSLIEGSVVARAVSKVKARELSLKAGARLQDEGKGDWKLTDVDVEAADGWTSGRLAFDQESVGRIAELMNRYSAQKIVIADPALAEYRLSAVLKAGDIETFVSSLTDLEIGRVVTRDVNSIVLTSTKQG